MSEDCSAARLQQGGLLRRGAPLEARSSNAASDLALGFWRWHGAASREAAKACKAVAEVLAGSSTCAQRIAWLTRLQPPPTLSEAAAMRQVAREFPQACGPCDPQPPSPPALPRPPGGIDGCAERNSVQGKAWGKMLKLEAQRASGHQRPSRHSI